MPSGWFSLLWSCIPNFAKIESGTLFVGSLSLTTSSQSKVKTKGISRTFGKVNFN